jgi:hypothetical protein
MIWLVAIPVFMAIVAVVAGALFVVIRSLRRTARGSARFTSSAARGSGFIVFTAGSGTAVLGYGWILLLVLSQGRFPIAAAGSWNVVFGGFLLLTGLVCVLVGAIVAAIQSSAYRAAA